MEIMRMQRAAVVALGIMALATAGCSSGTAALHPAPSALVVGVRTLGGHEQQTVLLPLDPVTGLLGASIVVPAQGVVAVAPGGRFALLVDPAHDLAYRVELASGQVGRPIHVGSRPSSVAFSPGGTMAYIADAGSNGCAVPGPNCSAKSDIVTPVNLTTDEPGHPIHTCPGPMQVAMAPSGDMLWVACFFDGVDEISTSSDRVVAHFDVPGSPGNFAFADAGRTVIVGQIGVEDLQIVPNYIVLIDPVTRRVGKPIKVGLPGGTSIAAVTPAGVAYIDTWGHTGPRGEVTTEIIPLDLRSGRLGPALAVRASGEPVAVVGYWPGTDVRYVTYPDSRGDLWEGTPDSSASRLVSTGIRDTQRGTENAQIVATDPTAPYLIVRASSGAARSIKTVNLTTGHVGRAIQLPPSLSPFFSVQFP
jgi:hypothetical protein